MQRLYTAVGRQKIIVSPRKMFLPVRPLPVCKPLLIECHDPLLPTQSFACSTTRTASLIKRPQHPKCAVFIMPLIMNQTEMNCLARASVNLFRTEKRIPR